MSTFLSFFGRLKLSGVVFVLSLLIGTGLTMHDAQAVACDCSCQTGSIPATAATCSACPAACTTRCTGSLGAYQTYLCVEPTPAPAPAPSTGPGTCACACGSIEHTSSFGVNSCAQCQNFCATSCREQGLTGTAAAVCTPTPAGTTPSAPSAPRAPRPTPTPTPTPATSAPAPTPTPAPGATNGDTSGFSGTGVCQVNCIPQRVITCNNDADCQASCTSGCPNMVANSVCATNPAAACVPHADGTKTCAFQCTVRPSDSCEVGDRGNAQCGSRCAALCAPATGASGSAPPVCSTTPAPACGAGPTAATPTEQVAPAGGGGSTSPTNATQLTNPVTGANNIPDIIGKGVRTLLGVVGAIALFMFVLGGVRWILAAGDPKAVTAASETLRNATIGLAIIFFSYSIISLGIGLVNQLGTLATPTQTETDATRGAAGGATNSVAAGSAQGGSTDRVVSSAAGDEGSGTCTCHPDGILSVIAARAAPADLVATARRNCEQPPVNGRFDATSLTCVGNSTQPVCAQVQTGIQAQVSAAGMNVACDWVAGGSGGGAGGAAPTRAPVQNIARTPGPQGECRCAPSGLGSFATSFASETQVNQARQYCEGGPAYGRFDRNSFTCSGTSSAVDCRQVESTIQSQLPTGITVSCGWTAQ